MSGNLIRAAETSEILSFDNTEIAFKHKSDEELNKAYWLFKIMGSPLLVKTGIPLTNLALNLNLPVISVIKKTIFEQFCGGENILDCERTIQQLAKGSVGTILDYSVEGEEDERAFTATAEEIIHTIKRAQHDSRIPFTVFKLTGIARFSLLQKVNTGAELSAAEQAEYFKVKARVNYICRTAFEFDVPVMIDAEESWIQNTIDDLALEMMRYYNRENAIVFNTYQLYRRDKLDSLEKDIATAADFGFILGAKLVRGAYMEKERMRAKELAYRSPIQDDKASTDADYNKALDVCIKNLSHVAIVAGTHNEDSCLILTELMKKHALAHNHPHIYFSQLLGMSDNLSFNLANAGYNVAKYVPYGPVKAVMPYLFRRAEENKSIAGQTGRELSLIIKEKKRRRKS
ncbi:proline dehydrogenase family protein [Rubrolithibacter danxiaensis]|uniref:proline dehydrogenase family protein n=1 Tax=Rubrolithibacter danxiaensis TaxID=3390805 RepID=UPI003BF8DB92